MANEFIIKNGFHSKGNSELSGSLTFNPGDVGVATIGNYSSDGNTQYGLLNISASGMFLLNQLHVGDPGGNYFLFDPGTKRFDAPDFGTKFLNVTASGAISASGLLFASASEGYPHTTLNVIAYDTASGQFYYTGSTAIGSGTPTLQQVTTAGATTTQDVSLHSAKFLEPSSGRLKIDADSDQEGLASVAGVDFAVHGTNIVSINKSGLSANAVSASLGLLLNDTSTNDLASSSNKISSPPYQSSGPGRPILIQPGVSTAGYGGAGGHVSIRGGNATNASNAGNGGNIYLIAGATSTNSSTSGSVYLDGNTIEIGNSSGANTPFLADMISGSVFADRDHSGITAAQPAIRFDNSAVLVDGQVVKLRVEQTEAFRVYKGGSPNQFVLSGSGVPGSTGGSHIIATTGSFGHIITDGETIEFNTSGTKLGSIKFDTGGMKVEDSSGNEGNLTATNITASGNISSSSTITGNSFVKGGGTSAQFLKADGSVDSSTYLTAFTVQEDGSNVETGTKKLNFTGNAVTAATDGVDNVTLTISTGSAAEAFPFTGNAQITGSLTITGSLISIGIQKQADVTNTVMGPGAGGTSMDWNGTSAFGENILIGSGSGKSLTISTQNTFIGNLTGTSAGAGVSYNTLVGYKAGNRLYVGSYNTFVGRSAGGAALINGGNYNTFLGAGAGDNITSGDSNVFLGASAGALIQEGSNNIGIGYEALYNSDTSGNNIAIGTSALKLLDVAGETNTATDNIAIGHTAGASLTSGTKNIIIGSGSLAADNPSNQIRIGHADLHIISGSLSTGDVIFYNTASAPNFSGSFQGDGSQLTGTGTVVTGNGGGSGDTLDTISIGGTTFTVTTGTGNGTVDTSGTPVDNDFAKFTDGNTIEGRSISETKSDLSLNNVENTALSTYTGNGGALDNQYIANNAGYTTNTGTLTGNGTSTRVPFYNGTTSFTTNAGFVYTDGSKRLDLTGIASSGNSPLRLSNLQEDDTDSSKALILATDDDIMWRELGTNAFNSTTIPTNNNQLTNGQGFITSAFPFTGSANISGSLEIIGSGSGLFSVEGSVGTLFSVDDGLDDVIFAANNISGTPVISANADNTVKLGKLGGFGIVISGSTPAPNDSQAKIIITGSIHTSGSLGVGMAANSTIGRIDAKNDVVAFSTSDERLKDNIAPIEDALTKVSQVQGIKFDWIPKEGVHGNEGHDVGVIAQEIEKVLPEVVTTRDNGYKAVKYEKIIPLLVEAIKELQEEIKELKKSK